LALKLLKVTEEEEDHETEIKNYKIVGTYKQTKEIVNRRKK